MSFWSKLFGSSSTLDSTIQDAVRVGDLKTVKALLDRGANVNAKPNKGRVTILHSTAAYGHKDVVELLLAKGADVNAKDINRGTPLHSAAGGAISTIETQGHTDAVELLLAKGADGNAKNANGWTPLYLARYYERRGAAELLRRHGCHE